MTPGAAEHERREAHWRRRAVELSARCEALVVTLEESEARWPLPARECFELFAGVGCLALCPAWRHLPEAERLEVAAGASSLARRLEVQRQAWAPKLDRRLSRGLFAVLLRLAWHRWLTARYLRWGLLGEVHRSAEFRARVLDPLDRLGYALALLESLGRKPSPRASRRAARLDRSLRKLVPDVLRAFAEADDPARVPSGEAPESFWWHRAAAEVDPDQ